MCFHPSSHTAYQRSAFAPLCRTSRTQSLSSSSSKQQRSNNMSDDNTENAHALIQLCLSEDDFSCSFARLLALPSPHKRDTMRARVCTLRFKCNNTIYMRYKNKWQQWAKGLDVRSIHFSCFTQKYADRNVCTWFSYANLRQLTTLMRMCECVLEEARILNFIRVQILQYSYNAARYGTFYTLANWLLRWPGLLGWLAGCGESSMRNVVWLERKQQTDW